MSKQQTVPTTPWWKNKKIIIRIALAVVLAITLFILFLVAAYTLDWAWTGLPSSHKTTTITERDNKGIITKETTNEEDQPAKTLWDWLPLLIQLLGALAIPVVVGLGAAYISKRQSDISEANRQQQHDTDLQIAEIQQQEELLRTYFDKISDLLLDKEASTNPNIQSIVRARTLAALHILNTERKAIALRFLHDSDLLRYVKSVLYWLDLSQTDLNRIDLNGADLRFANLRFANLRFANLSGANLNGASLRAANLSDADLSGADLTSADIRNAILNGANFRDANLSFSRLNGAYFINVNLNGADLRFANLSGIHLSDTDLSGAIATPEQSTETKNMTPEQLAQIKSPKPAVTEEATSEQVSTAPFQSEGKPDQTSQEEAEELEHTQPKQGTDNTH